MFTPKLTGQEVISIICASPPGTAVHHSFADRILSEMPPPKQMPRFDQNNPRIAFDVMPLAELMRKL